MSISHKGCFGNCSGFVPGSVPRWIAYPLKDGEAFLLFDAIIDAFEKAHDIDPTIPRLVPISMRRHFGKHARKAPTAPPAPPIA